MSCRRRHSTNLIGCRVGDVALRGCCRGCCPYPDEELSRNSREHLLLGNYPPTHQVSVTRISNLQPPGRRGLYYNHCQTYYRPKFICPKAECRRMIKPFYDPEKHEYQIDDYQHWDVRPLQDGNLEYSACVRRSLTLDAGHGFGRTSTGAEKRKIINALLERWRAEKRHDLSGLEEQELKPLTEGEMEELKMWCPEVWWTTITGGRERYADTNPISGRNDNKRCPSCGDGVIRVGPNFRVPRKGDDKAWSKILEMIDAGDDLEARFTMCWTIEQHEYMTKKALEIQEQNGS